MRNPTYEDELDCPSCGDTNCPGAWDCGESCEYREGPAGASYSYDLTDDGYLCPV